eukprot:CAMPEP_0117757948 /NCGR_PEP_ID=MMETSP0947-20121206/15069_1 /TAXON_ID=44440 /ORGANISM="Chattonella subsalsa, Strain CCMP2191" /LENGTH=421 /DNA_ID=CAMNT_0005578007 /DNA_START=59 /DNA_END=1327 /DNA_ORIENTATION=-
MKAIMDESFGEVSDEDLEGEESGEDIEFLSPAEFQPIISRQHAASIIQAMRSRSTVQTLRGERSTQVSVEMGVDEFNYIVNEKQSFVYGSPSEHSSDGNPVEKSKDFLIYYAPKINPNAVTASQALNPPASSSGAQHHSPKRTMRSSPVRVDEEVDTDSDWCQSDDGGYEEEKGRNLDKSENTEMHKQSARRHSQSKSKPKNAGDAPGHSGGIGAEKLKVRILELSSQSGSLEKSSGADVPAPVTPNFTQDELAFYRSIMQNGPRQPVPSTKPPAPKTAWEDSSSDEESDSPPMFNQEQYGALGLGDPLEESAGFYLSDEDLGPNDAIEYLEEFQSVASKTNSGPRLQIKSAPSRTNLDESSAVVPEVGSEEWVKVQYKKRLKQTRKLAREEMRNTQKNPQDSTQQQSLGKSIRRKKEVFT